MMPDPSAAGATTPRPGSVGARWSDWAVTLPALRTPALLLREPRPSDATALWHHLATKAVSRLMLPPPRTPEGFERFIAWSRRERQAGRWACFAIVPQADGEAMGLVQVRSLDSEFGAAEWGFCVGARYWGTGIFIESARAVADFLFRHVGVRRLEARVVTENARAIGSLMKLGGNAEGVLRAAFERDGERLDQMLWTVYSDEWLSRNTVPAAELERTGEIDYAIEPALPQWSTAQWTQAPPSLEGPRGTLRELTPEDAPRLHELLSTPAIRRFAAPPLNGVAGLEQYIRSAQGQRASGRAVAFGIVPARHERAAGIFQLHSFAPRFDLAEWGCALGEPYWGTGLFVQAAELLLQFAFDTVKVRRLEARVSTENGRANAALLKIGATPEGCLRRSFLVDDHLGDEVLWSILRDEWQARRGCPVDVTGLPFRYLGRTVADRSCDGGSARVEHTA